jgi:hypothetical protein
MRKNMIRYPRRKLSDWLFRQASQYYLGYPAFGTRIIDRHHRWHSAGRPDHIKHVVGKVAGQEFARSFGMQVPVLYTTITSIVDLPNFSDLPDTFVLKPITGHSSNNVFALRNGINIFDQKHYSRDDLVSHIGQTSGGQQRSKFLIEELLQNFDGKPGIPNDYKFYCFGENIALIQVIERNSTVDRSINKQWFLTEDWRPLGLHIKRLEKPETSLPARPDFLEAMASLVKGMGAYLNMFMRIDMYATTRGPVFGELTPFPNLGRGYTPEANAWLGRLWIGEEGCDFP